VAGPVGAVGSGGTATAGLPACAANGFRIITAPRSCGPQRNGPVQLGDGLPPPMPMLPEAGDLCVGVSS